MLEMNRNLFYSIFKYRPNENLTPEENFITESFVYLLYLSKQTDKELLKRFIYLLNPKIEISNWDKVDIQTQITYNTSYSDIKAIPDISIIIDNVFYFIEVKVSSQINQYEIVNDEHSVKFDQLEKYQQIKLPKDCVKHIYTLTENIIDIPKNCDDYVMGILWNDIYILLKQINQTNFPLDILIQDFIIFMEELQMNTPKVSYELVNGLNSFRNLLDQIEIVLKNNKIPFRRSLGNDYFGYYVYKDESQKKETSAVNYYGWIGSAWEPEFIKFQFNDKTAKETISNNNLSDKFGVSKKDKAFEKYFYFYEHHYFCLKPEEQLEELGKWINENFRLLINLSESKLTND